MESTSLKTSLFFQGMSEDEIGKVLQCLGAFEREVPKGGFLLEIGSTINEVGLILVGAASVVTQTSDGQRSVIEKLLPGHIYGEEIVLSGVQTSSKQIQATERTVVLLIGMQNIVNKASCPYRAILVENLLRLSAAHCMELNRKIDILSRKSVRARVLCYLCGEMQRNQNNEFKIPFNRTELAEYLQLDRSALSRELSRIRNDGIITFERARFWILKPEELERQ